MKPGRRAPKRSARAGRSTNRAVIALAVLGGLVVLYGWNSFFLAPKSRAKAAVAQDLSTARTQEQTLKQSLAQMEGKKKGPQRVEAAQRESEIAVKGKPKSVAGKKKPPKRAA